jgi:RIO kinase 1
MRRFTLQDDAFEHFLDEGLITKVIRPIKSGKEASVYLCRANPSTTGETLAALKVFHPPDRRAFRDEGIYRDGEFIKPRRVRVAVEKRTAFGKVVAAAIWVDREWEMLKTLSAAGADVPKPIMRSDRGLLMTYIGDEDDAAPQLRSYRPDPDEAEELLRQVIRNVELFLYRNVIHGDLSPYNILVWDGQVTLIDLPQAVDPRKNRHARALLERDLHRVCEHFERFGVQRSAGQLTADLWTAWEFADLVPEELRGLA